MKKLRLEIDTLQVETFESAAQRSGHGTVRGLLTAYYELCQPGDTWQQTCTCELTCNANTCYNCGSGGGTAGCTAGITCPDTCVPPAFTAEPTCERDC